MLKWIEWVGASLCVTTLLAPAACAQGGMGGGRGGGGGGVAGPQGSNRRSSPADYYRGTTPPPHQLVLTPHCGQYLTNTRCFELVLTMVQARIYVYDKSLRPQAARDVRVQMSLQVPGEREIRRIPFQYVPLPPGAAEQDCVVANFDFAQLGDKEVPLTIAFFDRPDHPQPTASFTPLFSKDTIRPYVAQVVLTQADRDGVLRQRVCPVSGDGLGTKGQVVKVLVGELPLYLCCKDCIQAVRQTPDRYVPHLPAVPANQFPAPAGNR